MYFPSLAATLFATSLATTVVALAESGAIPSSLNQSAKCMYKALKAVPGVTDVRLGKTNDEGWLHPYLEYRADEGASREVPIRFNPIKSDQGGYWFLAYRSGAGGIPDLHVTDLVMKNWKAKCRVDSNVILP